MTNRILLSEMLRPISLEMFLPKKSSFCRICLEKTFDNVKYYALFASRVVATSDSRKGLLNASVLETIPSEGSSSASTEASTSSVAASTSLQPDKDLALKQKDGHLWECIGRREGEYGGYVYHFRLRDEYNLALANDNKTEKDVERAICEIQNHIFPATEPVKEPEWSSGVVKANGEGDNLFKELGYSYKKNEQGECYLSLPDSQALNKAWEKTSLYRNGHLPDFRVGSSEGIASDLEFVEGYLENDAVLSSGIEFVHDYLTHVGKCIEIILSFLHDYGLSKDAIDKYENCITGFKHTIKAHYDAIPAFSEKYGEEKAKIIAKILSMAVDMITASSSYTRSTVSHEFYDPESTCFAITGARPLEIFLFQELGRNPYWRSYLGISEKDSFATINEYWSSFEDFLDKELLQKKLVREAERRMSHS